MDIFEIRLKELRKEKNLTQKELAQIFSTTDDSIFSWEKGRSQPPIDTIRKFCEFFEVSADYLLGRSDDFGNVTVKAEKTGEFLAPDEKSLMKNYRNLSADWKNQVRTYIELINQKN